MAKIPIDDANAPEPDGPTDGEGAAEPDVAPAGSVDAKDPAADDVGIDGDSKPDAAGANDLIAEAEAIVDEAAASTSGAADPDSDPGDSGDPAAQLEVARQQASEWQDRYLRLHAEWDTYRRRTTEQRAEEKARATEKLVEDLIPVLDDFERTVAYADENGETGLLDGVKAVQTKLVDALTKSGLAVIDPAGEAYDALEAQAVATVPDEEAYDETVREVYQKGYKMGKKVLRPAMVTVTTGGPERPKPEESESE